MQFDRRTFIRQTAGAAAVVAFMPDLSLASRLAGADPLQLAVIGAGRQGRAILAELQKMPACKVIAVCDSDDSRLQSGLRRSQNAEGFADYKAMLDKKKEIQGIIVATPTHLHRQIALDCIAAGKHVYCEAPLASTVEDSRAIAAAAGKAKTVFAVGLEGRSNPIYKLARTFYKSDAFRDLISVNAQHHQKNSWRIASGDSAKDKEVNWRLDAAVSTGLMGELGAQQFDVVHWYLGAYPTVIRGYGDVRFYKDDGRKVADTASCDMLFSNGVRLHYQATLANSFQGRHEIFSGSNAAFKLAWTHGWMFKEADAPTQGWEVYANRQQFGNEEGITLIADATKLASQGKLKDGVGLPNPSLYYALEDFAASVLTGKPPTCSAEEGMRASIVAILANKAVVTGEEIKIAESDLK
ncbi:MAG: Gfo/Idh/MocA family oxidoreductase [Pyrinomonadaceae bacterium]|nr:Gfo/Idh/MocA family oxidoreductase [Phycisphaerales bacterium]